MTIDRARFKNVILDERFGTQNQTVKWWDDVEFRQHEVKKIAVTLLFDALDCLQEMKTAISEGSQFDTACVAALQDRTKQLLRIQRLLQIEDSSVRSDDRQSIYALSGCDS